MSELALERIREAKKERLTKLDLCDCGLTELPNELFELIWLEVLILKSSGGGEVDSSLDSFWRRFCNFFYLDKFVFPNKKTTNRANKIEGLNPRIKELQALKKLEIIGADRLDDLSPLKDLYSLQELSIPNSQVKDLSPLKELHNLQYLWISHSQVSDLTHLKDLQSLRQITIGYTQVSDLSPLKYLEGLQRLMVYSTKVSDLSPLKNLQNLNQINFSDTQVSDLSPLKNLQNLKQIDFSRTKVIDLSPLKDLQNLNRIDFSNTKVSDLSPLKDLQNLNWIDFSNTEVSDLSPLKDLQNLNRIDFSGTQVSDLRPLKHLIEKGLSVSLEYRNLQNEIIVRDCPLSNPPKAIVEQGNAAILNYFRQIEEQGTVPLYEAKLIMVGEPGAGKTSLTEKLINENHKVIPDDPNLTSTLGINIRENWIFPDCHRQTGDFTSHIWDFGGQEIQYMTHQFFLSPESLYVLVADDRKQHTLFPYWFEVIHLLGKDDGGRYSPIIVVLNERKHKSITNFDLVEYRRKYPDTQIDVLEVDLVDDNLDRFRAIRTKIQQSLCKLDHIGRPLPGKWSLIREEIRALNATRNHISQTEFNEICRRFNIEREDDIQLIGKYLHRLGIILHFQGDIQLRDFIIINPKWALKAVYAVLENKDVVKRFGRFTDADLDNYWQDLSADEKRNILSLMKKDSFEICYPIGNNTYIAPQLLAQIRPSFKWDNTTSLKCQFFYRFMPKGIITRIHIISATPRK